MDKLKMHSLDGVARNIELIGNLFPNAVTEVMRDGKVERAIDFDVLRQELSDCIVEGREERYQFTWPDKKKAMLAANAPITATLRPVVADSVGRDGTPGGFDSENLYIEGDNLEVLKLLQETYLGKVKMIYIDPPYNTGNDFVYEDDFAQSTREYMENSGQYDEAGNRMVTNTESNGRFHTDWLNMIYPRLRLAKDLLTEDGVIFISVDDNEVGNLRKICDEVFGTENQQAMISYVRKTSGKQDSQNFMKSTEYILIYSKSDLWHCSPLVASERVTDRYNKTDELGKAFRETDLRKTGNADRREDRPLMWYPFYYNPDTCDLLVRSEHDEALVASGYVEIYPIKPDGSEGRWRWGYQSSCENIGNLVARIMPKYKNEGKYTVYEVDYIDKKGDIRTVKEHTSWDKKEFNSDNAIMDMKRLGFSNQLFPFPKSTALIKHIVYLSDSAESIILDFFSGSATTAHAVMQLNAEDGGHRKFIMVQLPEPCDEKSEAYKAGYPNICEIGKERIRRAGRKIKEDTGLTAPADLDIGFRCLRLDESNMKPVYYTPSEVEQWDLFSLVDNVKPDRTPEDLLFQVMLDLGVLLSSPIEVKEIAGKKVFNVADGFLLACFDHDVTDETVKAIAQMKPYYAVFRDSSMANDSVATNFDQIFETYSPDTVRKVL